MAESWWIDAQRKEYSSFFQHASEEFPRMRETKEGRAVYLTAWQAQKVKEAAGHVKVMGTQTYAGSF